MENPIMNPQNEHCSKGIYNNVRQILFISWIHLLGETELAVFELGWLFNFNKATLLHHEQVYYGKNEFYNSWNFMNWSPTMGHLLYNVYNYFFLLLFIVKIYQNFTLKNDTSNKGWLYDDSMLMYKPIWAITVL